MGAIGVVVVLVPAVTKDRMMMKLVLFMYIKGQIQKLCCFITMSDLHEVEGIEVELLVLEVGAMVVAFPVVESQ